MLFFAVPNSSHHYPCADNFQISLYPDLTCIFYCILGLLVLTGRAIFQIHRPHVPPHVHRPLTNTVISSVKPALNHFFLVEKHTYLWWFLVFQLSWYLSLSPSFSHTQWKVRLSLVLSIALNTPLPSHGYHFYSGFLTPIGNTAQVLYLWLPSFLIHPVGNCQTEFVEALIWSWPHLLRVFSEFPTSTRPSPSLSFQVLHVQTQGASPVLAPCILVEKNWTFLCLWYHLCVFPVETVLVLQDTVHEACLTFITPGSSSPCPTGPDTDLKWSVYIPYLFC